LLGRLPRRAHSHNGFNVKRRLSETDYPKLTREELGFVIEPQVRQFCGPIFFTRSLQTALGNVIANGSFGLVATGSKKLLVTNFHVWDGFHQERLDDPNLQMCISVGQKHPVVFAPDKALSEDRDLDIATFDMEPLLAACGERKFYPLNQNPARQVAKGDVVYFIGFPGHLREVVNGTLGWGRSSYGLRVCSVDRSEFGADVSHLSIPQEQYKGISGCPCFLVRSGRPIQLVGFARGVWSNYLRFTHACCLNADGTLK
jgi:hypothetical protein